MSASKCIPWCILIVAAGSVLCLSAATPDVLSDKNIFLKGFVGDGFLDVLGVILAITLASSAQLHLSLIHIEEKNGKSGFYRVRKSLKEACSCLIYLFVFSLVLVVVKPMLSFSNWSQSLFNGSALFVLIWYVLILISITEGTFAIKAEIPEK